MRYRDRTFLWLVLIALAFGAGMMAAQWPSVQSAARPLLSPMTPTPLPTATPPPPTPTPSSGTLPTLYLEIAPDGWARITAKREEALQRGILIVSKRDYVPATLRYGDQLLRAKIRLKGDWIDHLLYDKWSFRLQIEGEGGLEGMRRFSLQDPGRRSYLNEWLFLENLRREDVLAVRYGFVHLVLNGEDKGIYAVEESFSKELLESQRRREGPIIRWDEDLVWAYRALYDDQLIPRGVNDYHLLDVFDSARWTEEPTRRAEVAAAEGMLRAVAEGKRPASEVFDVEAMGRFLAQSDLWCAPHGLIWHNLRFYYDPVTARLEPIAYDSDVFDCQLDMAGLPLESFYGDPRLQQAYVRAAWQISDPAYLDTLEATYGPAYRNLREALLPEFGEEALTPPWGLLRERQRLLREVLQPYRTVYAYTLDSAPLSHSGEMTLAIGNLLDLPVEVIGLELEGQRIPLEATMLAGDETGAFFEGEHLILPPLPPEATALPMVQLRLPADLLPAEAKPLLVTRLWGLEEEHREPVLRRYPSPLRQGPRPLPPTLAEAQRRHPFLQVISGTQELTVRAGSWDVQGDLIVPQGYTLHLPPGTTLRFEPGAILLSNAPLQAEGTEDAPVQLLPQGQHWGGVIVLDAAAPSFWHHTLVSATTGITREGWLVSGGVTFYRSPLRMSHCQLLHSRAEDTLNLVRTTFELSENEFGWTASDAVDVDFGEGTIERSSFHDVGGDAVDVSGTHVQVRDCRMQRIADKGLSAGEISHVEITGGFLDEVGMGIVSKDLSRVSAREVAIRAPRIAALAAYVKKPLYGPATLIAEEMRFIETDAEHRTLVQAGCTLRLDGQPVPGTVVDVGALYGK